MSQIVPSLDLKELNKNTTAKRGKIQLIFGPMFSGKSTELIRRLKRYQVRFNYLTDFYIDHSIIY